IMAAVNEELCRENPLAMFVTPFFATLDLATGELRFCNAGHPSPYVVGADGSVAVLAGRRNKPLGVVRGHAYESASHTLRAGDGLFIYTDGVTEAVDGAGALYTEERLRAALQGAAAEPAATLVTAVMDSMNAFVGEAPRADDVAALA